MRRIALVLLIATTAACHRAPSAPATGECFALAATTDVHGAIFPTERVAGDLNLTNLLNAEIADASVPLWVPAALIAAGLLLPLLVALAPVLRASRVTVREALADAGVPPFGGAGFERRLAAISWLPRPLLLFCRSGARSARLYMAAKGQG